MKRGERDARCALIRTVAGWEIRVLVSNRVLLCEACIRAEDAFALAKDWRRRMTDDGWKLIVPRQALPVPDDVSFVQR
jgi:hypothetical protein